MKRRFQLTGAVLSIIVGALSIFGGVVVLYIISMFSSMPDLQSILIISALVVLGLGLAIVILGSLLCKKKKSHGVAIALLILTAIIAVFQIVGTETLGVFELLIIVLQLTSVAMLLVYLILKEKVEPVEETETQSLEENQEKPAVQSAQKEKIDLLMSLRNDGTLNEEEFKELLKKELEK